MLLPNYGKNQLEHLRVILAMLLVRKLIKYAEVFVKAYTDQSVCFSPTSFTLVPVSTTYQSPSQWLAIKTAQQINIQEKVSGPFLCPTDLWYQVTTVDKEAASCTLFSYQSYFNVSYKKIEGNNMDETKEGSNIF